MVKTFSVLNDDRGQRLDVFLLSKFPEFSRSHIKNMIEKGKVSVDGKLIKKAGTDRKSVV